MVLIRKRFDAKNREAGTPKEDKVMSQGASPASVRTRGARQVKDTKTPWLTYTYGFGAVDGVRFEDPLVGRLERFRRRFAGFGEPVPAYLAALQCDEQLIVGRLNGSSSTSGTAAGWS